MKRLSSNVLCVLFVTAFFTAHFCLAPSCVEADWPEPKELPGNDFPTELAIVAGVLVVGLIVILLVKKSHKDDKKEKPEEKKKDEPEESDSTSSQSSYFESQYPVSSGQASLEDRLFDETENTRVKLYLGVRNDNPDHLITRKSDLRFSNQRIVAGFSLSF